MNRTFHITTFGCQMNEHDSETIAGMLDEMGMTPVPTREEADLIFRENIGEVFKRIVV